MDFNDFAKQIALLRKSKKISQNELSKDIGISRATLSSFENGRSADIGFKKVLQILDYLDYEITINEKNTFPTFEELRDER